MDEAQGNETAPSKNVCRVWQRIFVVVKSNRTNGIRFLDARNEEKTMDEKNMDEMNSQEQAASSSPASESMPEAGSEPKNDLASEAHEEMTGELVPASGDQSQQQTASAEALSPEDQQVIDSLDGQIKELMKKYKMTMWALVACIVAYLIFLFVIKASWSTWVVLGICVVMIALAVMNTRYSRRIQKLDMEKQKLKKQAQAAAAPGQSSDGRIGQVDSDEAIVANAASLNDLPRQYTVLDEIEFSDGQSAENIVVSPYGVAVVGSPDLKPELEAILQEAGVEAPIFFYSPDQEVAALAEEIQMEKTIALDEKQIMDILYKLTGLKD